MNYIIKMENDGLFYYTPKNKIKKLISEPFKIEKIEIIDGIKVFSGIIQNIKFQQLDVMKLSLYLNSRCLTYKGYHGRVLIRNFLNNLKIGDII